jgi:Rieske Fe-S protein
MAFAGGTALVSLMESCASLPIYNTRSENEKIRIPIEKFGKGDFLIVRPADINNDLAVVRKDEDHFQTFVMKCTHADNPLNFNGTQFHCSLHGSLFDQSGNVKRGPAERPLRTIHTERQGQEVVLSLNVER